MMKTVTIALALLFLSLPTGVAARGGLPAEQEDLQCLASFVGHILGAGDSGQRSRGRLQAPSASAPELSDEACLESLIDQLAQWGEYSQPQRGKPAPPPPPSGDPPARYWHAFTGNGSPVPEASRLYLFGGDGEGFQSVPADLWYYRVDRADWFVAPAGNSKPGPRKHVGLSCGAGHCVVSNGGTHSPLKETWAYAETTGAWTKVNCNKNLCPSERWAPTMAYDPARSYHVLFGGHFSGTSMDDTYTYASGKWTARNPNPRPPARDRAAATFVPNPVNRVILSGGQRDNLQALCDMYAWSGSQWLPVTQSNAGPCLHSHSMVWDGSRLVVTGGYSDTSDTVNDEVWYFTFSGSAQGSWSVNTNATFSNCAAGADEGARMAFDVPTGKKVFFGGGAAAGVASDQTVVCN